MKVSDIEAVVSEFSRGGFLVPVQGTKKASASRTAYTAVQSGATHERMRSELFDPLTLISHHVSCATTSVQHIY